MSNTFFASAFRRFVLGAGLMVTIGFGAMVHSAESILDNVNLALDSKLRQSSQAFEGEPARAIDGNTDGDYLNGHSVTHTEKERNAWWEADLGRERPVSMVAFYNRTDCCEERLDDVEVILYAHDRKVVARQTVRRAQRVNLVPLRGRAQFVRLQLRGENYLSLAEVQIFGVQARDSRMKFRWSADKVEPGNLDNLLLSMLGSIEPTDLTPDPDSLDGSDRDTQSFERLRSGSDADRAAAAIRLGSISGATARTLPALLEALNDSSLSVQHAAVLALIEQTNHQTFKLVPPVLAELLHDPDRSVKIAAGKRLTGASASGDPAAKRSGSGSKARVASRSVDERKDVSAGGNPAGEQNPGKLIGLDKSQQEKHRQGLPKSEAEQTVDIPKYRTVRIRNITSNPLTLTLTHWTVAAEVYPVEPPLIVRSEPQHGSWADCCPPFIDRSQARSWELRKHQSVLLDLAPGRWLFWVSFGVPRPGRAWPLEVSLLADDPQTVREIGLTGDANSGPGREDSTGRSEFMGDTVVAKELRAVKQGKLLSPYNLAPSVRCQGTTPGGRVTGPDVGVDETGRYSAVSWDSAVLNLAGFRQPFVIREVLERDGLELRVEAADAEGEYHPPGGPWSTPADDTKRRLRTYWREGGPAAGVSPTYRGTDTLSYRILGNELSLPKNRKAGFHSIYFGAIDELGLWDECRMDLNIVDNTSPRAAVIAEQTRLNPGRPDETRITTGRIDLPPQLPVDPVMGRTSACPFPVSGPVAMANLDAVNLAANRSAVWPDKSATCVWAPVDDGTMPPEGVAFEWKWPRLNFGSGNLYTSVAVPGIGDGGIGALIRTRAEMAAYNAFWSGLVPGVVPSVIWEAPDLACPPGSGPLVKPAPCSGGRFSVAAGVSDGFAKEVGAWDEIEVLIIPAQPRGDSDDDEKNGNSGGGSKGGAGGGGGQGDDGTPLHPEQQYAMWVYEAETGRYNSFGRKCRRQASARWGTPARLDEIKRQMSARASQRCSNGDEAACAGYDFVITGADEAEPPKNLCNKVAHYFRHEPPKGRPHCWGGGGSVYDFASPLICQAWKNDLKKFCDGDNAYRQQRGLPQNEGQSCRQLKHAECTTTPEGAPPPAPGAGSSCGQ